MKILIVSLFYPPEMGAPAGRFHDFAQHWVRSGHDVTVLTGFPNFPGGEIHAGYRGRFYQRERQGDVDVRRSWILTTKRRGLGRPLVYATFLVSSVLCSLFARLRYDVVVATSPPPTVGLPGLLAAWRRGVPLVFDIRDIWPDAIVESGRLDNPLLIRAFRWIADLMYRRSDRVTAVTQGWVDRLQELGVPAEKLAMLPNGVDVAAFDEDASGDLPPDFDALDPDAHWFSYAGIFNTPQGLEVILDAARRMKDRRPDLYEKSQFVFVGEGPTREELYAQRERLGLERVVFIPRQPRTAIFALLRRSFAVLVTLRPRKDTSTVPSKIYESLASGRPVLFSAGGEGAETIRRAEGGSVCTPGDPDSLCEAMCRYLDEPALADRDGASGRRMVESHFDRRRIAGEFERLLEELVASDR